MLRAMIKIEIVIYKTKEEEEILRRQWRRDRKSHRIYPSVASNSLVLIGSIWC